MAEGTIVIQIQMAKSTHWKLALVIRRKNIYRILSPRITKQKISKISWVFRTWKIATSMKSSTDRRANLRSCPKNQQNPSNKARKNIS
jgi:hypothetical protein